MNEPATKPYPWSQKYTDALNAGVRLGQLMLKMQAAGCTILRRVHDFFHDLFRGRAQAR